jgi:hypothetical protein
MGIADTTQVAWTSRIEIFVDGQQRDSVTVTRLEGKHETIPVAGALKLAFRITTVSGGDCGAVLPEGPVLGTPTLQS